MDDYDLVIPYRFVARDYQIPFLREVQLAMIGKSEKRFFYQIWHRRSGKDKSNIADVVPRRLVQDPCQVKYVYPTSVMGRAHMWDAIDKNGFKFTDHVPPAIRQGDPNKTRMTIDVNNGSDVSSIFQVAGANKPDDLRGGNAKLFVFSEWADHDPYSFDVIEPIVRENDGIVIFNTTPKGDNHARQLFEYAKSHPKWFVQTLTVDDTGVFTDGQMDQIKEDTIRRFEANGRGADEAISYINQEYYCSFDSPVLGSYFGAAVRKAEKEGRITGVPYEETLPVHTAWDLGVDDSTTIWFFQVVGREIRFIDYYENSGEGLNHYVKYLKEKPYIYGDHLAPHDIKVRELSSGKSRLEIARSLGIKFTVVPNIGLHEGINAARTMFTRCWFDKNNCNRGLSSLKNYKKDWDDKNMVFRNNPLHNWASHGADAFRTFAVGYKDEVTSQPGPAPAPIMIDPYQYD